MEKLYELHAEHRLRPRRRRHAADPQRPRLPRRPPPADPLPGQPPLPGARWPDPRRMKAVSVAGPRRSCGRSPGWSGAEVVGDAIAFFEAFEGMERDSGSGPGGAGACWRRRRPRSSWWPPPAATRWRRRPSSPTKLAEAGIDVDALVVNRMHPRFPRAAEAIRNRAEPLAGTDLGVLDGNLADFALVSEPRGGALRRARRPGRARPRWCGCRSSPTTCTTSTGLRRDRRPSSLSRAARGPPAGERRPDSAGASSARGWRSPRRGSG